MTTAQTDHFVTPPEIDDEADACGPSARPPLKSVLKRGALVAAANWQVAAIQFVADSTVKLLLTVPVVGGMLLVALVLDRDVPTLAGSTLRASLSSVGSALTAEPIAFAAFLVSFAVVGLAGSVLLFLTKGGTVAVLAAGERDGGPIEEPPLLLSVFLTAARFSLERFRDGCRDFFRRFLRLGLVLISVYTISAGVYLAILFGNWPTALTPESDVAWTVTAGLASTVLAIWITSINFLYGLIQMVIVTDDVSVRRATRRVIRFLGAERRLVFGTFGLALALVVGATIVSVVATTGLGLIAFVPLVGLAVVPLQLLAWLFRGLVFQFIEVSAIGSYLAVYRRHRGVLAAAAGGARHAQP